MSLPTAPSAASRERARSDRARPVGVGAGHRRDLQPEPAVRGRLAIAALEVDPHRRHRLPVVDLERVDLAAALWRLPQALFPHHRPGAGMIDDADAAVLVNPIARRPERRQRGNQLVHSEQREMIEVAGRRPAEDLGVALKIRSGGDGELLAERGGEPGNVELRLARAFGEPVRRRVRIGVERRVRRVNREVEPGLAHRAVKRGRRLGAVVADFTGSGVGVKVGAHPARLRDRRRRPAYQHQNQRERSHFEVLTADQVAGQR